MTKDMDNIIIAFDIDGTLRKNVEERHKTDIEVNEDVLDTLRFFAKCKNTEIHLWSNRGAEYCQEVRKYFGLQKYVKESHCHLKQWQEQQTVEVLASTGGTYKALRADAFVPDIAVDDQQRFDGGILNLIVREK